VLRKRKNASTPTKSKQRASSALMRRTRASVCSNSSLMHRSAWKRDSRKFTVASDPASLVTNASPRPSDTPSAPKRGNYVPFVAPLCIKLLRLATAQLPENSGPSDRDSIKLRLYGFVRGSLPGRQKVPLGIGLIVSNTKIFRLADARLLPREHHERRGKGNLLARPERKASILPGVPGG
jgi:hypothetical protein